METLDKKQAKKDLKFIAEQLQEADEKIREAYERIQEIYGGLNDEDIDLMFKVHQEMARGKNGN